MKKLPHLAAALVLVAVILTGCASETKRTPIDCRYTAAYSAVETVYEYKYDYWNGEWRYLPEVKTVQHPESWEILYDVEYDDGSSQKQWVAVSQTDYELFREEQSAVSK